MRHSKSALAALLVFCALDIARAAEPSCIAATSLDRMQRCDANLRAMAIRKDELFILVRDGGAEKLLAVRTGMPLDTATVLIPARSGRVLASVHAAKDAIYVLAREAAKASLLRIPVRMSGAAEVGFTDRYAFHCRNCRSFPALRTHRVQEVVVPSGGEIVAAVTSPEIRGITLAQGRAGGGTMRQFYDPATERWERVPRRN